MRLYEKAGLVVLSLAAVFGLSGCEDEEIKPVSEEPQTTQIEIQQILKTGIIPHLDGNGVYQLKIKEEDWDGNYDLTCILVSDTFSSTLSDARGMGLSCNFK